VDRPDGRVVGGIRDFCVVNPSSVEARRVVRITTDNSTRPPKQGIIEIQRRMIAPFHQFLNSPEGVIPMRKANLIKLAVAAIYLLAAPLALGQGGNPPASTKESGATSGKGLTAAEQTGRGKGSVEEQIKALHEQGRQAALKGDSSFAEKYLADDYIGVGGDGQLRTKAEVIQMFKSASLKYESINQRVLKIRTYGDTAVVNTEAAVKLRLDGKPTSGDFRAIFIWVKQKGKWKEVAFQSTQVAPPSK
jgi:uncharacterized protein (TIGR02246 family)